MRLALKVVLIWTSASWLITKVSGSSSRGLVRYQRGDQGPDDLDNDITIIDTNTDTTVSGKN